MREILFRGQTRRLGEKVRMNGEKVPSNWVYGGVCHGKGAFSIIYGSMDVELEQPTEKHVVYSDTVGQYTGLTDKNGKKIFEGDIVKHYNHCDIKEYSEDIGRVFYYTETCRFLRTSKLFPDDCPEICSSCEYEVIGNIHHNSYLLESQ